MDLISRLEELERKHEELEQELASPALTKDRARFAEVAGKHARKIEAYEAIDERIVATLQAGLEGEEYRVLVVPDHPTPVRVKTHTSAPVPFLIFDSRVGVRREGTSPSGPVPSLLRRGSTGWQG